MGTIIGVGFYVIGSFVERVGYETYFEERIKESEEFHRRRLRELENIKTKLEKQLNDEKNQQSPL